jgi:hypothetical protein
MFLLRPVHWYHPPADLIWPVGLFNNFLAVLVVIYFMPRIFQALAPRVIIICHKTEPKENLRGVQDRLSSCVLS